MRHVGSGSPTCAVAFLSWTLLAASAHADEASEQRCVAGAAPFIVDLNYVRTIDAATRSESVEVSRKAREFALRGDYARAADLYKRAYALWGNRHECVNTETLFALGVSEQRAGRTMDALVDLRAYALAPDREADKAALAEKLMEGLYKRVGRLDVGGVAAPEQWYVDGVLLPDEHRHIELPPGESRRWLDGPLDQEDHRFVVLDLPPGTHEIAGECAVVRDGGALRRADWYAPGERIPGPVLHAKWHASLVVHQGEFLKPAFEIAMKPVVPAESAPTPRK